MNGQFGNRETSTDLVGFVAVIVTGVLVISACGINAASLAAAADLGAAYLAWRLAARRAQSAGEAGPTVAG